LIRSEVSVASTGRQCKLPALFSQPAEQRRCGKAASGRLASFSNGGLQAQ
jgi:hypothetical protein